MEEREDEWAQRRMPKFPFAIGGFLTDRPERTSRGKDGGRGEVSPLPITYPWVGSPLFLEKKGSKYYSDSDS